MCSTDNAILPACLQLETETFHNALRPPDSIAATLISLEKSTPELPTTATSHKHDMAPSGKDQGGELARDSKKSRPEQNTTKSLTAELPPDDLQFTTPSTTEPAKQSHQPRAHVSPDQTSPKKLDPTTKEVLTLATTTPAPFSLLAAPPKSALPRSIRPCRLTADQSASDLEIVASITPTIVDYVKKSSGDFDVTLRSLAATLQKIAFEAGAKAEVQESSGRKPPSKEDTEFAERLLGAKEGKDTCWGLPWGGN